MAVHAVWLCHSVRAFASKWPMHAACLAHVVVFVGMLESGACGTEARRNRAIRAISTCNRLAQDSHAARQGMRSSASLLTVMPVAVLQVRQAYQTKGWVLNNLSGIEQCKDDGYLNSIKEQEGEGCHIWGQLTVSAVAIRDCMTGNNLGGRPLSAQLVYMQ